MAIAHLSTQQGQASTSAATTTAMDTTGATLAIIAVVYYGNDIGGTNNNGAFNTAWVSDNQSNTYTALTDYRSTQGGNNSTCGVRLFYCMSPTTSVSHTATINAPGTNIFPSIVLSVFSGTNTSSVFDVENGNPASGGPFTSVNAGTISAVSTAVAYTALCHNEASATQPTGFTIPTNGNVALNGGIPALGLTVSYKLNAGTVTNPTWAGATDIRAASIASFKQAGGGGGVIIRTYYDQIPQRILNV